MKLPTGFVPNEDQGYFFNVFTLPDGASMERTDQLMRRAEADLKSIPGVAEVLTTGGLNLLTNAYTSNNASVIAMLKPWEERKSNEEQLGAILAIARRKFAAYPEAVSLVFPPPPINGLGNASGFVFELQDKVGRQPQELAATKDMFMQAMAKRPELTGLYSGFSTSVPQIKLDIDRDKVRTLNIPINSVFQGLQIYLGGLQVNDFNLFGRTYKVMLQAEQEFRKSPESINDIYVRSSDNSMVPMSTISTISMTTGPDILQRYNMFRTAEINGANGPGVSTGQALDIMEELASQRPSSGLRLRVDQHRLPGEASGRYAGAHFWHGHGLCIPGAGGAVRKLGGAFLRAARIAHRRIWGVSRRQLSGSGKQRVCSDRHRRADGAGGEERHSDR